MTRVRIREDSEGMLHCTVEAEDYLTPTDAWTIAAVHLTAKRRVLGRPVREVRKLPAIQLAGGVEYHYAELANQEVTHG